MAEQTLTPWFPASVKPARVGVYMRRFVEEGDVGYSFWDGERWMWLSRSADEAIRTNDRSYWRRLSWRGLASDPSATVGKGRPHA